MHEDELNMSETVDPSISAPASSDDVRCLSYEEKLSKDLSWAMNQGSRHFDEKSAVHETLMRICRRLSELKIASGMTGQDRLKDIVDVQELVRILDLPQNFGQQLSQYVQQKV